MKQHDATEIAYKNGYEKGASDTAKEILDELLDAVQSEREAEDKLGRRAWEESDTVGYHIHQYAEEKLGTFETALSIFKNLYLKKITGGKT